MAPSTHLWRNRHRLAVISLVLLLGCSAQPATAPPTPAPASDLDILRAAVTAMPAYSSFHWTYDEDRGTWQGTQQVEKQPSQVGHLEVDLDRTRQEMLFISTPDPPDDPTSWVLRGNNVLHIVSAQGEIHFSNPGPAFVWPLFQQGMWEPKTGWGINTVMRPLNYLPDITATLPLQRGDPPAEPIAGVPTIHLVTELSAFGEQPFLMSGGTMDFWVSTQPTPAVRRMTITSRSVVDGPEIHHIALSPDGQMLAVVADGLEIRRAADGTVLHTLLTGSESDLGPQTIPLDQGKIKAVAFTPDGQAVTAVLAGGLVRQWRVGDGSVRQSVQTAGAVDYATIAPDNQTVAIVSSQQASLWRVQDRHLVAALPGRVSLMSGPLAFSPDSQWVAAENYTDSRAIRIWRVADGTVAHTISTANLPEDSRGLFALAFSPDNTRIAGGDQNGRVRVWQVSDGTLLQELVVPEKYAWMQETLISPDGRWLVARSLYGRVRLWSLADLQAPMVNLGVPADAVDLAFSADGTALAAGLAGGEIGIWNPAQPQVLTARYPLTDTGKTQITRLIWTWSNFDVPVVIPTPAPEIEPPPPQLP